MKIYIILIILLIPFLAFSEANFQEIDRILESKNLNIIDSYLQNKVGKSDYAEIEEYMFSKAKDAILEKKYEYARSILQAILNNNLDNQDAQDIYLSIQGLKKDEKKAEQKEKERTILKQFRENQRQIEADKKIGFKNFRLTFALGAVDFMLYQSNYYNIFTNTEKYNFKYGLNAFFSFYFYYPFISPGIDVHFDSFFVNVYQESGIEIHFKSSLALTIPLMKFPLYIRGGYAHLIYYFPIDVTEDVLVSNLFSPTVGLRLKDLYFNKFVGIDITFDLYLIGFMTSYFDGALDFSFSFLTRFLDKGKYKFFIKTEVISFILFSEGKVENNIKFQLSCGISINEK